MNKKGFCIRCSLYFKRLDPSVSLVSLLAKYWINVLVVLNLIVFQPKRLSCIVFNVKTVQPGTQPNIIRSRKYFSIKSENKSFSGTFTINEEKMLLRN